MEGRKDQISKAGYNQETYYLAHVVQNVVVIFSLALHYRTTMVADPLLFSKNFEPLFLPGYTIRFGPL